MAEPRRRQAGEGSISEYATKAGPRFLIKFTAQREEGTKRVVLKRGFRTRKDAAAALRKQIGKIKWGGGSSRPSSAEVVRLHPAQVGSGPKKPTIRRSMPSPSTSPKSVPSTATEPSAASIRQANRR